jgi:hypothetical protein
VAHTPHHYPYMYLTTARLDSKSSFDPTLLDFPYL